MAMLASDESGSEPDNRPGAIMLEAEHPEARARVLGTRDVQLGRL